MRRVTDYRRHVHANPELSNRETAAVAFVGHLARLGFQSVL